MLRCISAFGVALLLGGCASLVEPLEQSFLFRRRPASPERYATILERDPGVEEVRITADDGVLLHGLLKRAPAASPGSRYPLVIVFGGVARETSWMVGWGDKPAEWGWLLVNYRGYGLSEGTPSERVILADTKRIYDWAAARPDIDSSGIVLLGRSLGSHFAVALAAERPVRGLILATPFDSLSAIADKRYPFMPNGALLNGRYEPAALAPKILVPALFVLAENDDVTPIEHGQALAANWGGPKRVVMLPETGHRMVEWRQEYWREISAFLGEMNGGVAERSVSR